MIPYHWFVCESCEHVSGFDNRLLIQLRQSNDKCSLPPKIPSTVKRMFSKQTFLACKVAQPRPSLLQASATRGHISLERTKLPFVKCRVQKYLNIFYSASLKHNKCTEDDFPSSVDRSCVSPTCFFCKTAHWSRGRQGEKPINEGWTECGLLRCDIFFQSINPYVVARSRNDISIRYCCV